MAELRSLLAFMDPEDRNRALLRYERLFDLAGEDGEEELIRQLGSPIRQVLEVETEYRKAQREGRTPFEDDPVDLPPDAEMIPSQREETPFGLSMTVREAADTLARAEGEKIGSAETVEEDLFPIADLDEPENMIPGAVTGRETKNAPADGADVRGIGRTEDTGPKAGDGKSSGGASADEEIIPAEDDDGKLRQIVDFAASVDLDDEDDGDDGDEEDIPPEKPGAARVFAAILVTVPFIALWIVGFVLSLVLGAAVMGAGFVLCAAGVYFTGYVVNRMVAYMPDMLLVAGGALGCFALALLLIWTGLWIAAGGCVGVVRLTANAYRRILRRRLPEEDEDYE